MTNSFDGTRVFLRVITGDHVPSFKNTKRSILDSKTGKQRTLTPGNIKKRMDHITNGLVSALIFAYQTTEGVTSTGCSRQSWIASKLPGDDSIQWIPEIHIKAVKVPKGEEGFEITITEIV